MKESPPPSRHSLLSPKDERRLGLLRELDPHYHWRMLEDERLCVLCEHTLTGRSVRIIRHRSGSRRLGCPTPGCAGGPAEWVRPGNPLLSEEAWTDWTRLLGSLHDASRTPRTMRRFRPSALVTRKSDWRQTISRE